MTCQKKCRAIICGGRTELNYVTASSYLYDIFHALGIENAEIVSGGCKGADKIGERFAQENNLDVIQFLPEWNKFGKAAGIKRNMDMVDYIKDYADSIVIAFWNGESRGTKSTITQARKFNIPVYVIDYKNRTLAESIKINSPSGDFALDASGDIISLTNTQIHSAQFKSSTHYFEYTIKRKAPDHKKQLNIFEDDLFVCDFKQLIDIAVKDICTAAGMGAEFIIHPQSDSKISNYTAHELAEKLSAKLFEADSQSPIKPGTDMLTAKKIIILDDIISPGTAVASLISSLRDSGYDRDIIAISFSNTI